MEISAINDWLGSVRNFNTGLQLYNRFGNNDFLKSLFAKGENAYTKTKLAEELVKMSTEVKSKPVAILEKRIYAHENYSQLPQEVIALINQAKQIFKENAQRQSELYYIYDNKTTKLRDGSINFVDPDLQLHCALLAHKILDEDDFLTSIFNKIDYFHKNKVLPPSISLTPETLDFTTAFEVEKELQKVRQFISKNKDKPLKADLVNAKSAYRDQLIIRRNELI